MPFGFIPEVAAVALLQLSDDYVQLFLKIGQHLLQFRVRLLQFLKLPLLVSILLPQPDEFFAFAV
jgi:hypothetical protein